MDLIPDTNKREEWDARRENDQAHSEAMRKPADYDVLLQEHNLLRQLIEISLYSTKRYYEILDEWRENGLLDRLIPHAEFPKEPPKHP